MFRAPRDQLAQTDQERAMLPVNELQFQRGPQHWPAQHFQHAQEQYYQPGQPAPAQLLLAFDPPQQPLHAEHPQHPQQSQPPFFQQQQHFPYMHNAEEPNVGDTKRIRSHDAQAAEPPLRAIASMEQPIPTLSVADVADLADVHFSASALREPIVIIQNMLGHPQVKFDNTLLQYESLDRAHLSQSVKVLYQTIDPCGWNIQGQYWMKHGLSQYISYMKRVDFQIKAFRNAIGLEATCATEPGSTHLTGPERSDIRTFLMLSQEQPRTVPAALQATNVGWRDMSITDFQKINKKGRTLTGIYRRMKTVLEQLPAVHQAHETGSSETSRIALGEPPYELSTETYSLEDETFFSVGIGESVVLLYGPLECGPDGPLPFELDQITVDGIMDELVYVWKNTQGFLNPDPASKRARQFDDMVQFCSNLDIGDWNAELEALSRRLPPWMWCNSQYDVLGLLRQPVEGMNVPQLYLKAPGSWTGGHEENCRFRSVNCNHGPGSSEWFAIDAAFASILRERVLNDHGIDIYSVEGNWFPDPKWLDEYEIPYMTGIQRPGDVVTLKGATLHWVRSLGCASHSSWNFGLLEQEQLDQAMQRYWINDCITPAIQNLVPMKTLMMDLCRFFLHCHGLLKSTPHWQAKGLQLRLHHEPEQARAALLGWILAHYIDVIVEDKLWREYATKQFNAPSEEEPKGALVVYCQQPRCVREITTAYFRCDECDSVSPSKKPVTGGLKFMCMPCGVQHAYHNKRHKLHFLHKDSMASLMQDLQQMMVFVARHVPETPTLFAQRTEQAVLRVSGNIKRFEGTKHHVIEPVDTAPKKRGRPSKKPTQLSTPPTVQPFVFAGPYPTTQQGAPPVAAPPPVMTSAFHAQPPIAPAPQQRQQELQNLGVEGVQQLETSAAATYPFVDQNLLQYLTHVADSSIVGTLALINALHIDPRYAEKHELLEEAASTAMHLRTLLSHL